ncbi:LuxR C-terminal-related transcriptional regulator [Aquibacillus saliphilus]|uniref:LuxR C-terminal-related transcriptional regulator n=1 Tax=Aquibacillus saliphilus TaxID=1909422 RepID=UPI001CF00611|nr:LuxR C-terminal-related transcriptional regulator [Aquibacillus saliphilus]
MQKKEDTKSEKLNESYQAIVTQVEHDAFVGREKELAVFRKTIRNTEGTMKILNIYGTGGIGKTFLLSEFSRIAEHENCLFLQLDSRDFIHTPLTLVENLLIQLYSNQETTTNTESLTLQNCFQVLRHLSIDTKVIIAIDSYEHMGDLDRWFRNVFLSQLPKSIVVVLSGRKELKGEWKQSPAWRKIVKQYKLDDLNYNQTKAYLANYQIHDDFLINTIWQFTKGHPLTISLAALTVEQTEELPSKINFNDEVSTILMELTTIWLHEVRDEKLSTLLEAAAMLRHFDQVSLSYTLKQTIPISLFTKLTSLSFVRKRKNGWAIHDLIRDAIRVDLKARDYRTFERLNQRCAYFYHNRISHTKTVSDIAEFFYHLGDELIKSTFFQNGIDTNLYLEHVGEHNIYEVDQYFQNRKQTITENTVHYLNYDTSSGYDFYVSMYHNKKETEFIDINYINLMGHNVASLLKNDQQESIGMSVVIPINEATIEPLTTQPVSASYFQSLSNSEYNDYAVASHTNSGWFIRMLDCLDPTDTSGRSFLLFNLFPLLLSGGRIITSTPLPFYQQLLESFGFKEVPGATNYDFGNRYPSPSYILDVRGQRLSKYLEAFTRKGNKNNRINDINDRYSFTEREQDIVLLILDEYSNAQIAERLFVAEVTVKKHMSRILKKVNVKNRAQLIKRLMEINYM